MKKITCPKCGKKAELITDWNHPILSCKCRLTKEEHNRAVDDDIFNTYLALTEDGMTAKQALAAMGM